MVKDQKQQQLRPHLFLLAWDNLPWIHESKETLFKAHRGKRRNCWCENHPGQFSTVPLGYCGSSHTSRLMCNPLSKKLLTLEEFTPIWFLKVGCFKEQCILISCDPKPHANETYFTISQDSEGFCCTQAWIAHLHRVPCALALPGHILQVRLCW